MKKLIVFLFSTSILIATSCQKEGNRSFLEISSLKTSKSANNLVLKNTYIDLDTALILKGGKLTDDQIVQGKAAVYRFYKHIKTDNGFYETDLQNAEQINISKELFTLLLNNINEMNSFILQQKEQGKKVEVTQITEKYLNSLLE